MRLLNSFEKSGKTSSDFPARRIFPRRGVFRVRKIKIVGSSPVPLAEKCEKCEKWRRFREFGIFARLVHAYRAASRPFKGSRRSHVGRLASASSGSACALRWWRWCARVVLRQSVCRGSLRRCRVPNLTWSDRSRRYLIARSWSDKPPLW